MPDLGQWLMLAVIGLAIAAAIAWPLLRPGTAASVTDSGAEAEARALRHRVALDALLDVEADRRAGSLDEASYARERAEAEARAAQTLLDADPVTSAATPSPGRSGLHFPPRSGLRSARWSTRRWQTS